MAVVGVDHFETLYRQHADPWRVGSAWYEKRKRALLLAALGREHYRHAFEPGCGNGDLTLPLPRAAGRTRHRPRGHADAGPAARMAARAPRRV
ncbi:MAG: hypothetical protein ACN6OD_14430 [Alcaligenes sp.]